MARDAGRQGVGEIREASSLPESAVKGSRRARRIRWLLLCAFAGILLAQLSALGAKETKPTRVVSGVVSDASENPISGAVVTLKDLQDGKKMAIFTGQTGAYQFSDLQITRDYEVQATYKGVSSRVRRVSMIDPRNRIVLNLRIPPPKDEE
jgi:hypothetical protein